MPGREWPQRERKLLPGRRAWVATKSGLHWTAGVRGCVRVRVGPGHWDVPDACAVLPEAWQLVERGHVAVDDFKAFTHDNALALWGDEMFANTVIGAR